MPIFKRLLQVSLCFALLITVFLSLGNKPCFAQQNEQDDWLSFQTAYFTVYYKPDVNLKRVLGRLSSRDLPYSRNTPTYTLSGVEAKLAYRFDVLFMRVKDILGMNIDKTDIKIRIHKNRKNVNAELCYLNSADEACRSFYVYRYNTIYTSEQDITDSIVAHEMAHAVIDNYFSTTPPEKTAEILATNVDAHLDD